MKNFSRRTLLQGAAAATGILIIPRHFLGDTPNNDKPSNRVNIANIGLGTRGKQQIMNMKDCSCDVDKAAGATFQDYREMFDKRGKDIDAVLIATPDHTHAIIAMEAIRRGKHVYVEKPLAHSIAEVRALIKAANENKVVTQLGNQGHSYESCARCVEWVRDGAIGKVKEVWAAHPAANNAMTRLDKLKEKFDVPAGMDWEKWIGPAQYRGYNPMYHPHNWRDWTNFGTGACGDFLCHILDPGFWAADLQYPDSVEVSVEGGYDPKVHFETFAVGKHAKLEFRTKSDNPVTVHWVDGTAKMPKPEFLEEGRHWGDGGVIVGENGGITHGVWGADGFRVYPETKLKDLMANKPGYNENKGPPKTIARGGEHHEDFIKAIRNGKRAGSDFEKFGGPLTEVALLSIIGMLFPNTKLLWDGPNAKFTNNDEANKLVNPPYREGWKL